MSSARALILGLALAQSACAVSGAGISPSDVAFNQCSSDTDCPNGGTCNLDVCQGAAGTLTSLLIAVTPPSTLVGFNSFTYFSDLTSGGTLGSGGGVLDLSLADPTVSVTGQVWIDTTHCTPSWATPGAGPAGVPTGLDGSIPAIVTFTPSQGAFGVPVDSFSAQPLTGTDLDAVIPGLPSGSFGYAQTLPAGEYDVYVKPAYPVVATQDCSAPPQVPPRLFLHETVSSTLNFTLPAPSTLTVNVTWPLAAPYVTGAEQTDPSLQDPLSGWTLDLIDQTTGKVLSSAQTVSNYLTPPMPGDTSVAYASVPLVYAHVSAPVKGILEPVNPGSELLRLTPPATDPRFPGLGVPFTAPTILSELDGALVDSDGKPANAQIVQSTPLATPVTVQFQTALQVDGTPMAAGVLVTAESIVGITGLSTAFSRSIQVGADGNGSVDLLPGRYRVIASPIGGCADGSCLALVESEWVVAAAPAAQAGKLIEFVPAASYGGSAFVPGSGLPAAGATVHAVFSALAADQNVLNVGNASTPVVPRATSGLVESDGSFAFEADTGVFDVRVEPDPSTGYGWIVMPGFSLPSQQDSLNGLELDWPIIYRGKVSVVSGGQAAPIPKALIRAYAYINPDGTLSSKAADGTVAIQVAETYSDDASGDPGAFRLLIPRSIQKP